MSLKNSLMKNKKPGFASINVFWVSMIIIFLCCALLTTIVGYLELKEKINRPEKEQRMCEKIAKYKKIETIYDKDLGCLEAIGDTYSEINFPKK